jgi:hypothetical protein
VCCGQDGVSCGSGIGENGAGSRKHLQRGLQGGGRERAGRNFKRTLAPHRRRKWKLLNLGSLMDWPEALGGQIRCPLEDCVMSRNQRNKGGLGQGGR